MSESERDDPGMNQLLTAAASASDLNERSRLISEAAARHLATVGDAPESDLSVPRLEAVIDDFPPT